MSLLCGNESEANRRSSRYRGFLKVSVGKALQLQTFDVHESLITTHSDFFKKAIEGNWVEAKD